MGKKSLPVTHQIKDRKYGELKKFSAKRTNEPINKWTNELNRQFSKE
jgi:hypothetical protein